MTPIDLTQFTGHTPGGWVVVDITGVPLGVGVAKGAANIMVCNTLFEGDKNKDLPRRGADATLIAAAPDILARARELEGEVERLTRHANSHELHAAKMATVLGWIVQNAGYESGEAEPALKELNVSIKYLDQARAALAAWREAMGEGVK